MSWPASGSQAFVCEGLLRRAALAAAAANAQFNAHARAVYGYLLMLHQLELPKTTSALDEPRTTNETTHRVVSHLMSPLCSAPTRNSPVSPTTPAGVALTLPNQKTDASLVR